VTLYKGIALSFRKPLAVFLGLTSPHMNNGIPASSSETVDEFEVFFEMEIQSGPLSGKGHFHDDISSLAPVLRQSCASLAVGPGQLFA